MKKRGFTLIELLAVILILGIVALIAISTVSKIIEQSKRAAAVESARAYLSALSDYVVLSDMNSDLRTLKSNSKYNVTSSTIIGEEAYEAINYYVKIKGYKPTGIKDFLTLDENSNILKGQLTLNGYGITIEDNEITKIIKGEKISLESLSLELTETSMEKDAKFTLIPNISPSNASDQRVKFTSSDSSIVSVDDLGVVTAIKIGSATITVESLDDDQKKANIEIDVILPATGITLNKTSATVNLGSSETILATLIPSDTTTSGVEWTSNPTGIVNVENGVITTIEVGTTTVTATTSNGKTASATITVDNPATAVTLNNASATITVGDTSSLIASLVPSNSTTSNTITWVSSAPSIASVSASGIVTALTPGTANITATTENGKTATSVITVISKVYANGTAVYFNPVTGIKCTAAQAVSATGTKTGCMKWYTFNDGGSASSIINLILDHNTTAVMSWNSSGSNVSGPTNILTQLKNDTSSWAGVPTRTDSYSVSNGTATYTINYSTYKARLIKASEIATITGNSSFVEATKPSTSWFYLDNNSQTVPVTTPGSSNYDWLFDYTSLCTNYGGNVSDLSNYGYYTSTAVYASSGSAWLVFRTGQMYARAVDLTDNSGVRPVITISKSNL